MGQPYQSNIISRLDQAYHIFSIPNSFVSVQGLLYQPQIIDTEISDSSTQHKRSKVMSLGPSLCIN